MTREKTSTIDESNPEEKNTNTDIRTAFFKASTKVEKKPDLNNKKSDQASNDDDEFAKEIMKELQQKATKSEKSIRTKPIFTRPAQIPFFTNSTITQSPAHKRKLSPTQNSNFSSNETNRSKKIELDDDLIQQLFEDDCVPMDHNKPSTHLTDLSNTKLIPVKSEPIEIDTQEIKKVKHLNNEDERETLENIELLSQLTLDASMSKYLDLNVKREPTTQTNDSDLSLLINNQSKNSDKLLFYWLDAYEEPFSTIGTIYLFGKMPILNKNETNQLSFASVCCVIKNIPKLIYVLPRKFRENSAKSGQMSESEPITMEDVKKEMMNILEKSRIYNYKMKVVKRFYAFDRRLTNNDPIPFDGEYLQVEYFNDNQNVKHLPYDLVGETFSCVFGLQTGYLENFLIESKIKGPCWLLASNAKRRGSEEFGHGAVVSWCKVEYLIDNYRSITQYRENTMLNEPEVVLPTTPPLTIMTVLIKTMLNSKTQEHEIVCACALVSNKFYLDKATMPTTIKTQAQAPPLYDSYFCAITKPSSCTFPYDFQATLKTLQQKFRIEVCGSERALLAFMLCKMQAIDADIIIGHDLFGFNLDILLNRCVSKKVPHWSRLGRLKRSNMPAMPTYKTHSATYNLITQQRIQTVCSGRLLCDIMMSAKELLTKCKSFDLNELASHILFKKEPQPVRNFDEENNVANFFNSSQLLLKFIQLSMSDATYIMRICNDLQCLQLAYQITCIAGNVLSRTLVGGRSERNEFLLLHAFHDKEFILPDKVNYNKNANKSKQNGKTTGKFGANANKTLNGSVQVKNEPSETIDEEDLMISRMAVDDEDDDLMTNVDNKDKPAAKGAQKHGNHNGYTGGLVLEPKIGFYDRFILLLDFNSLYPSIIQEYNICFTTISRPLNESVDMDEVILF